jgi:hypothetical protein
MKYWTDYPVADLGDVIGQQAPIRECVPLTYDGNKYCEVSVGGVIAGCKAGYIYTENGRCGDVPSISSAARNALPFP